MNAIRSIAAWGIAGVVGLLGACGLNTEGGLASPTESGGSSGTAAAAGAGGLVAAGGQGAGGILAKGGSGGSGGASQPDASDDVGMGGAAQGGASGAGGTPPQGGAAGAGGLPVQGGAAGTGGATSPETDCTNGADDDGDGAADCGDDDCTDAGYVTLPKLPTGAVLYWFHERPLTDSVAACPTLVEELFFDFKQGSLVCDCACGAATGGTCNVPSTRPLVSNASNCGDHTNSDTGWGSCRQIPSQWTIAGLKGADGTVKDKATCTPSVSKGATTPPEWAKAVDLCPVAKHGKGADPDTVCVADAPDSYANLACVLFDGAVDCATIPGYDHVHAYYESFSDTRKCDVQGCSCDPATSTCEAKVNFYSDGACTNLLKEYPTTGTGCVQLDPVYKDGTADSYKGVVELNPGTCPAKGTGTVTGTAAPAGRKTLCCP